MNNSREHILKVAFILFLQKSFKAVTMKEIVEKTGLSKGAFYHYFSSKEELFTEILNTYYFRMMAVPFGQFSQKSFYEFYHDYIGHVIGEFMKLKEILDDTNDEDDINYFTLVFDAMNLFPGFKEQIKEHHVLELTAWADAVNRGRERGEIKSVMTNEQIARMFVYSSDGLGLHLIMEGRIRQLKQEMLQLWDGFYRQIKV